jgi:hypothetical protein
MPPADNQVAFFYEASRWPAWQNGKYELKLKAQ